MWNAFIPETKKGNTNKKKCFLRYGNLSISDMTCPWPKIGKKIEIFEMFKNVMLWSLTMQVRQNSVCFSLSLTVSEF